MKTLLVSSERVTPAGVESSLALLKERFIFDSPNEIIFLKSAVSDELAVRLSMRLDIPCVTDVKDYVLRQDTIHVTRGAYSGEIICEYFLQLPACISLCRDYTGKEIAFYKALELENHDTGPDWLEAYTEMPDEATERLSGAKAVVIAGRGIGGKANYEAVCKLSEHIGAQVGATRAVVMNGWAPLSSLVGVSGSLVSPEFCLIFGASGSEAFTAGIKKNGCVFAVNSDPSAAIFRLADKGVIGDCGEILGELLKL